MNSSDPKIIFTPTKYFLSSCRKDSWDAQEFSSQMNNFIFYDVCAWKCEIVRKLWELIRFSCSKSYQKTIKSHFKIKLSHFPLKNLLKPFQHLKKAKNLETVISPCSDPNWHHKNYVESENFDTLIFSSW